MGIRDWYKGRRSSDRGPDDRPVEMVRFFDAPTGQVVRIPATELRPGILQARIEGVDGVVWVAPDQLEPNEICHPPFDGDLLASVRRIHATFAAHCSLTFAQWEEGFRRDADPEREIARCVHAVNVYTTFTQDESDPTRREDVFRTVVACLTASADSVWHVLQTQSLTRREAQRVIDRFFRGASR
jgi:hypothetical protein